MSTPVESLIVILCHWNLCASACVSVQLKIESHMLLLLFQKKYNSLLILRHNGHLYLSKTKISLILRFYTDVIRLIRILGNACVSMLCLRALIQFHIFRFSVFDIENIRRTLLHVHRVSVFHRVCVCVYRKISRKAIYCRSLHQQHWKMKEIDEINV